MDGTVGPRAEKAAAFAETLRQAADLPVTLWDERRTTVDAHNTVSYTHLYRGERAQRGRFREFYQADIDVIGDGKLDIINEAEIPSIIYRTFSQLGLERFQIRVNNRKILNGFYAMAGLAEQSQDVMRTVDKLDKIGAEKVKLALMEDVR